MRTNGTRGRVWGGYDRSGVVRMNETRGCVAVFGEVDGCGGVRIHVHTRFSIRVCVYTSCVRVYVVCMLACMRAYVCTQATFCF